MSPGVAKRKGRQNRVRPADEGASASWPLRPRVRLLLGVKDALPIVMGYVPVGLALGVLAVQAGLTTLETGAMSAFVYAGASQFIGVSMLAAGNSPLTIILTTFLINSRHLLMSAALSPYMQHLRRRAVIGLSFFITDESFAMSADAFRRHGRADVLYMVGLYTSAYAGWFLATVTGAVVGAAFTVPDALALDFALPAMFIGLLAGQLRTRPAVVAAALAAVVAVMGDTVLGNWSVMIASVVAATAGVGVARWTSVSS